MGPAAADDKSVMTTVAANPSPPARDYSIPGLRIQRGLPGEPWALIIRAAEAQSDWVLEPTRAEDRVSIKETPTTFLYHGQAYRLIEREMAEAGWIYRLTPCPEGETWHHVVELSREAWLARKSEAADDRRQMNQIRRSAGYEIIYGWLPARVQENLSDRRLFSPEWASRKQALLQLYLCLGSLLPMLLIVARLHSYILLLAWFCVAIDGAGRWAHVMTSNQPCGLIPLELADRIWRKVRGEG